MFLCCCVFPHTFYRQIWHERNTVTKHGWLQLPCAQVCQWFCGRWSFAWAMACFSTAVWSCCDISGCSGLQHQFDFWNSPHVLLLSFKKIPCHLGWHLRCSRCSSERAERTSASAAEVPLHCIWLHDCSHQTPPCPSSPPVPCKLALHQPYFLAMCPLHMVRIIYAYLLHIHYYIRSRISYITHKIPVYYLCNT